MIKKQSLIFRRYHSSLYRFASVLVVLSFLFSQVVPIGYADITAQMDENVVLYVPETPVDQEQMPVAQPQQTDVVPSDATTDFYQTSALNLVEDVLVDQSTYDSDESSFEDAIAQFSPDYASAVVVESLTAENLMQLNNLDVEVGIAVICGKIVMFTTGSRDELRANPAIQSLLSESPILIHTHPQGTQTMPSALDIDLAGATTEYLLSGDGVYAYNMNGIVSSELSEADLLDLIEANHVREASSVEAREILNDFIVEIDNYNADPAQYSIYRSAER